MQNINHLFDALIFGILFNLHNTEIETEKELLRNTLTAISKIGKEYDDKMKEIIMEELTCQIQK